MKIEFEIITDIYNVGKNPKLKIKDDKIKKLFDLESIEIEEFIDPKSGKHVKKYCSLLFNTNYYKINKSYEDVKSILINKSIPVLGFAYKSKIYK